MDERPGVIERTEAYEVVAGRPGARVVVVCEHASARLPGGWAWPPGDERLLGTHWSYDIGAAECAVALAVELGAPAVLARFSRLLCDANRDHGSPTMFRPDADGPVLLNADLTDAERERRLATVYRPFHDRVDAEVVARPGADLFSMHSFTPVWAGDGRTVEIGVLYDHDEGPARILAEHLAAAGFVTRLNEPYSGRGGFMFCAQSHATRHGRTALELEVRQDLASSPPWRDRMVRAVAGALPVAYGH